MRFDLTVNEFTRDLWADRSLEVFGERFWRPYIHVRDAARAVRAVLEAPREKVAGQVFNAGHSDENYRKLDLVEIITGSSARETWSTSPATRTRATTRSPSRRSAPSSASSRVNRVPDGIEEIVGALDAASASATRSTAATGTSAWPTSA